MPLSRIEQKPLYWCFISNLNYKAKSDVTREGDRCQPFFFGQPKPLSTIGVKAPPLCPAHLLPLRHQSTAGRESRFPVDTWSTELYMDKV